MNLNKAWENAGVLGKVLIVVPMAVGAATFGYIAGALGMTAIGVAAFKLDRRKR